MVQPAARAEIRIKALLIQILVHRMKILLAAPVDTKYRTQCRASLDHWRKEFERLWRQVTEINQTHTRRRGQFFGDDHLQRWQESEELVEAAMNQAVRAYEEYLIERHLKLDERWLRSILEELYDGEKSYENYGR